MKVLVIGGGGREHALAWALERSTSVGMVASAPGNPGLASLGPCYPIEVERTDDLADCARREGFDLVVVGPEAPLVAGLADRLRAEGIACFGPDAAAAELEGSKIFAKQRMEEAGVQTAAFEVCDSLSSVRGALAKFALPVVLKADGLAAGKGVCIARSSREAEEFAAAALEEGCFGDAGGCLLIEECLVGEESSLFVVTDGEETLPLPTVRDYKRLGTGDEGPNTGGMGSYAPAMMGDEQQRQVMEQVVQPVLANMRDRGTPYTGLLYCGLMWTEAGPKVLEFNCRFGDPETQALMPLVDGDLGALLMSVACRERFTDLGWRSGSCATVVLAAAGYPLKPERDREITGVDRAAGREGVEVFHAGTRISGGRLVSAGGRVLAVSGMGFDLDGARKSAYDALREIHMSGAQWRSDIAEAGVSAGVRGEY
jgi:phosphoribosylamine--glycine ligase